MNSDDKLPPPNKPEKPKNIPAVDAMFERGNATTVNPADQRMQQRRATSARNFGRIRSV